MMAVTGIFITEATYWLVTNALKKAELSNKQVTAVTPGGKGRWQISFSSAAVKKEVMARGGIQVGETTAEWSKEESLHLLHIECNSPASLSLNRRSSKEGAE